MIKQIKIDGISENYLANDSGEIYSIERFYKDNSGRKTKSKKIPQFKNIHGYMRVNIFNSILKKRTIQSVHRMILMAFNPVKNYKELSVNHKNGVRDDNRLENLEWCTQSENIKHSKIGLSCALGSKNGQAKLNEIQVKEIKKLLRENTAQSFIAKKFNVSTATISSIKNKINWKHIL